MFRALPVQFNPFAALDQWVETLPPSPFVNRLDALLDKLAAKLESAKPVSLDDGVLHFNRAGDYTFDFLPNGKVKVLLDGGHATVLTAQQWASVDTFDLVKAETDLILDAALLVGKTITGVGDLEVAGLGFAESSAAGSFETSVNLDTAIGSMLSARGVEATLESLTVNGSKADAFKLLWDYLDDAYVAGNNYYNLSLNESFVRLGVEYTEYLAAGGAPLTGVMAKFAADGSDVDTMPERAQSMHDNLLGNLNGPVLISRFGSDPAKLAELQLLVPDAYEARPWFSGNDGDVGGPAHDAVRAFDYDHGWHRPDYIEHTLNATVDIRASRDGGDPDSIHDQMLYGDGNTNAGWNIVRHEGAGAELALNIKHRQGPNYAADHQDPDGTVHYHVSEGPQPSNPARAEWSFDFAGTELAAADGDTLEFKLFVDLDPSAGVNFVEYAPSDNPPSAYSAQNSGNYAFLSAAIDTDPGTYPALHIRRGHLRHRTARLRPHADRGRKCADPDRREPCRGPRRQRSARLSTGSRPG
jgi:hypothetical protein